MTTQAKTVYEDRSGDAFVKLVKDGKYWRIESSIHERPVKMLRNHDLTHPVMVAVCKEAFNRAKARSHG